MLSVDACARAFVCVIVLVSLLRSIAIKFPGSFFSMHFQKQKESDVLNTFPLSKKIYEVIRLLTQRFYNFLKLNISFTGKKLKSTPIIKFCKLFQLLESIYTQHDNIPEKKSFYYHFMQQ